MQLKDCTLQTQVSGNRAWDKITKPFKQEKAVKTYVLFKPFENSKLDLID